MQASLTSEELLLFLLNKFHLIRANKIYILPRELWYDLADIIYVTYLDFNHILQSLEAIGVIEKSEYFRYLQIYREPLEDILNGKY